MKKYKIELYWNDKIVGEIEQEAETEDRAIEYAQDNLKYKPKE